MVLEATVLVVDNSEYSRNGDFPRTRFEAQVDAVEFLFQNKRNENPENNVGLIAAAGDNPVVLSTFTSEFGKILAGLHEITIGGSIHLGTAIRIADLTLKHRQNKHQRERIVVFVCSPILDTKEELVKLGKKLRKNGVTVDIINFGEIEQNTEILEAFFEAAGEPTATEGCHLVTLKPGPRLLYEQIATSSIILGNNHTGDANDFNDVNMGGESAFMDFGVDPSMDPELAMALRLSMEEEQQRQERLRQQEQQQQEQSNGNNESETK
ncbi:similar to Saccharomyces cerevisiae YHR200W RPN10 Non-ATPase base subunit of the 19S regulatory particle (RP) of the 26S proteasome [Maudiozyma barnettii]|uniref:Similar to Saccharomyces cerevisiae YHR200W RPN10 Non-ATPase base subunit of the 19S regulatory particle (RP) of the 26S proteasome n=1 Tax=Maudiozyma barnettii TaxID=61262 RepID=A0A8H2ZGB5_9SACH|nr:proteasome regulatory particle base subunit RPN10 [Kazachstania barnettii]CAB4254424.1 similar to Saccharomyces cerevisiae YHR200W RPN10 Non-ATPase base subunit of the 19S regulatory particle (RP) of the 26S proteasome [Kazachstania barnettii]CAD1782359.1 similar to Saccharomyces cerevisiae YHR200W RPN10 Non-ATPase base subunit of the 19S regulatory particle (RP) of the 26S proteasome [Kazachstania barnettii]